MMPRAASSDSSRDALVFEIYGCPRSGAFAVHGRTPKGLGISGLLEVEEHLRSGGASVGESIFTLEALGFSSLNALGEEIRHRLVLCIAQVRGILRQTSVECGGISGQKASKIGDDLPFFWDRWCRLS